MEGDGSGTYLSIACLRSNILVWWCCWSAAWCCDRVSTSLSTIVVTLVGGVMVSSSHQSCPDTRLYSISSSTHSGHRLPGGTATRLKILHGNGGEDTTWQQG